MTIKDWIYLGITVASYLLAIIAGVYAKDKAKSTVLHVLVKP